MLSFFRNNKYYFPSIFFLIFFFLGINIYQDYGISIDEDNTRTNGFVGLKYIYDLFEINYTSVISNFPNINDYPEKGIGYLFDVPAAFIEYKLNIKDFREYILLRHLINFIFFFSGVIFFYLLLLKRFNSVLLSIFGCLFLIISPRIFAHSFFNNKDIVFMSIFIIATYFSILLIEKPNFYNSILTSIFIALSISIRILGSILPVLIIFFLLIKFLRNENKHNIKIALISFFFSLPFFTIIFYPFLWDSPILNFLFIFKKLANFNIDIHNFYLGEYVKAEHIPWHYSFVWIFSTTPVFYLILFFISFFLIISRIYLRLVNINENKKFNDLWRGQNEMFDLFFLLLLILPIFLIIIINSSLYSGWRHLYFLYPFIILQSIYALNYFMLKTKKKYKNFLLIFIVFTMIPNINWMIKNHPHQYVYFNSLIKKNFDQYFELDYWGLSINENLKYLSKTEKNDFTVSNIGNMDLNLNRKFLEPELRNKVKITGNIEEADYVIINNIYWNGYKSKKIEYLRENYTKFFEIKVDEKLISASYKKNIKK